MTTEGPEGYVFVDGETVPVERVFKEPPVVVQGFSAAPAKGRGWVEVISGRVNMTDALKRLATASKTWPEGEHRLTLDLIIATPDIVKSLRWLADELDREGAK
ncbi:MAG: hypothetical protein IMZ50_16490 [Candidatus Atribacteria bacterium]|nr:hypothetical protein [Candidatus Atribacteria bacterium]